jgi:hypothetical protein
MSSDSRISGSNDIVGHILLGGRPMVHRSRQSLLLCIVSTVYLASVSIAQAAPRHPVSTPVKAYAARIWPALSLVWRATANIGSATADAQQSAWVDAKRQTRMAMSSLARAASSVRAVKVAAGARKLHARYGGVLRALLQSADLMLEGIIMRNAATVGTADRMFKQGISDMEKVSKDLDRLSG